MKTKFTYVLFLAMAMACSKDDALPGGCSFTFNGSSYNLSLVTCGVTGSTQTASGTNATASQLISLTLGGGIDGIVFSPTVGAGPVYVNVTNPSISVSGKTWTFSGAMEDSDTGAPAGNISGSCTCLN